MGHVHEEITLKNAADAVNARRGLINEPEIRLATVKAMVDTGSGTLVISEELQRQLGLGVIGERQATLADETKTKCKMTEPVEIYWKNRCCAVSAMVLPGTKEVLLGVIPLEDMDLLVDPTLQKLVGAHGDEVVCLVK